MAQRRPRRHVDPCRRVDVQADEADSARIARVETRRFAREARPSVEGHRAVPVEARHLRAVADDHLAGAHPQALLDHGDHDLRLRALAQAKRVVRGAGPRQRHHVGLDEDRLALVHDRPDAPDGVERVAGHRRQVASPHGGDARRRAEVRRSTGERGRCRCRRGRGRRRRASFAVASADEATGGTPGHRPGADPDHLSTTPVPHSPAPRSVAGARFPTSARPRSSRTASWSSRRRRAGPSCGRPGGRRTSGRCPFGSSRRGRATRPRSSVGTRRCDSDRSP